MREIAPNEIKIFEQEQALDRKANLAQQAWLDEVKKSHQGLIQYNDTAPLFDEYLKAHHAWEDFFNKNKDVLLAQKK